MSYFDLDPTVEANALSKLGTIQPGDMGPGFFSGAGTGLARGAAQVTMTPAALLADAATPMLRDVARPFDQLLGSKIEDWLIGQQAQARRDVARFMPGPDVGTFGQLLFGGAQIIPQAIAGGVSGGPAGAAALPGVLQGYQTMLDMQAKGVDQATAAGVGGIQGVMTAAGVAIPATMAGRLLPTIGLGVGANVAQGAVTRGSTSALLEARGYADMAKQYQAFDTEAMIIDAVLGAALGTVALGLERATGAARIPPSAVDDALRANQRQHADVRTSPGVPADPASRTAHAQALEKAYADLVNERSVDVSTTGIADAEFVPNRAQLQAAVEAATAELSPLGKLLNEVDTLRADVEAAGLASADDPLFTGRPLTEGVPATAAAREASPPPRDFPSTIQGRAGEVFVGDDAEPVRFMLVEAGDLGAAVGKADNQFRDRTRAASQLQIVRIANDLQFGRLGEAPTMAEGAPTLANDGRIVGGNGRVLAIQRAYDQDKADSYRATLAERAAQFGLTREQVEGMQRPVLVRQFENPIDVRRASILSNEGGALRMSALEQAAVDAERMPNLNTVDIPESGDFTATSMRDFVRRWLSNYPQSEQGGLIASDGKLSAEGIIRLRNAVLHKAYGDSETLARLVESTEESQRNVAGALVKAAPKVAEARAQIEAGALHDRDIQPALLEAVTIWQSIRADSMTVDQYLAQADFFADPIGPEALTMLRHFEAHTRSQKAIAEGITGYYAALRKLGDPRQAATFQAEPPGRIEILRAVLEGRSVRDAITLRQEQRAAEPGMQRLAEDQRGVLLDLFGKAEAEKPGFDEAITKIAQAFRGQPKLAPIKGVERSTAKIASDYAGDASKIKDLLRATIEVDSIADARLAIDQIKKEFEVLSSGQRDLLDPAVPSVDGYRDAKFNVKVGDIVAEVQVNLPEMMAAKKAVHHLYEQRSAIEREFGFVAKNATPEQLAQVDRLNAEMRAVYDPAFASAQSRASLDSSLANDSGDTGAPLRRADSGENGLGGTRSQASEYAPQKLPSETGMPSTSRNSTPGAENTDFMGTSGESVPDIAETATQLGQILSDQPNAQALLDDGSTMPAGAALDLADANISTTQADAAGIPAAVACALRG